MNEPDTRFTKEGCKYACHSRSAPLAIGITGVEGTFEKGEVVALSGPSGSEFAVG